MSKLALYIRLSVEDRLNVNESESIINQRLFLRDYIANKDEFKAYEVEEYIDDGYSGTNEKRPSFQRLLEELKAGVVKVIIVKDLSRFMRDYIALGDYLENIFPFLGIRFIAVNDGYDSKTEKGNGLDLDVQFKTLLYDFYSKDASEKVKSVMTELKKQGKFLAWSPPFGYMRDPDDKHKIIVDEKTAWVVKEVYKLALEGVSTRKIASIMNEKKRILPSTRKKELTNMDYGYNILQTENRKKPTWTSGTVIDILMNENYTGTYVFNMQEKSVFSSERVGFKPKENWGRVFNNHEAIIKREDFDKVQKIKEENRFMKGKNTDYEWYKKSPLQSFARCNVCNHILSCSKTSKKTKTKGIRVHRYFFCRVCKANGKDKNTSRAGDLEEQVFLEIKTRYNLEKEKTSSKVDLSKIEKEIETLGIKKMNFFESYKLGKISREKFKEEKTKIDREVDRLEEIISESIKDNAQEELNDVLTRDTVAKYIDSIICNKSKVEKINWK